MTETSNLPVVYGKSSLEFSRTITYEEADVLANTLTRMTRGIAWFWGDFLIYIEKAFPDKWSQLIPEDLKSESLRNWKWVAEKFPQPLRDSGLAWSIYQAVAGIENMAERHDLLVRIKNEGLTYGEVRALVSQIKGRSPKGKQLTCPSCGFTFIQNK